jgi:hypothetical protein
MEKKYLRNFGRITCNPTAWHHIPRTCIINIPSAKTSNLIQRRKEKKYRVGKSNRGPKILGKNQEKAKL